MPPCSTAMVKTISSKMADIIALTTQGDDNDYDDNDDDDDCHDNVHCCHYNHDNVQETCGYFGQPKLPPLHWNLVVWMLLSKSAADSIR